MHDYCAPMTADVVPLFPTGELADETVRRTIAALIEGRGLTKDAVADAVGMNRATLYRRLAGRGAQQAFSAGEVASLARFLGVPVARLFDGIGGTFVPPDDFVRHPRLERGTRWLGASSTVLALPRRPAPTSSDLDLTG